MDNDRLLMCMPYRQLVAKAAAAGFRVYSIWDPALESAAYLRDVAERSEEMRLVDFADESQLRRAVAEMAVQHDVGHVLHFGREATQLAVCEESHALGLAVNPPHSIVQLNDKAAMRTLLRECRISPVRSVQAASPAHARRMLRDGLELPVVVKPAGLDGSRAVRLIEHPRDLDAWHDELSACRWSGPLLIEEYLRGPEFSVETLTIQGRHHVVGITAKRLGPPPRFVEMAHVHPAPLDDQPRAAIAALVVSYLDAAGYRFGPAHTEVILTPAGPRIVESQARLGGDRIPLLIEVATGFDIEAAVFAALAGEPMAPRTAERMAGIAFFDFGTGQVRGVDGVEAVARLPFVHELKLKVRAGETLTEVTSSHTRHGYVVIDAASDEQLAERVQAVRARLTVRVTSVAGRGGRQRARAYRGRALSLSMRKDRLR